MMDDPLLTYGPMVVVGMVLGAVFFGGLWATVNRLPHSRHPGLLLMSSVVLRTAIVLGGIWYFGNGDAASITACLAGFVGIRLLFTQGGGLLVQNRKTAR